MTVAGHPAPSAHPALVRLGLLAAAAVLLLDQAVKWLMLEVADMDGPPRRFIEVTGFFNLVMVWNRGVSFGLFYDGAESMRWVLIAVALAITVGLLVWLRRVDRWPLALSIGLVIGGAVGNVVDRLRFGAVADFFEFHVSGYYWPAFNVADSAITIGVVLIVADSLFGRQDAPAADGKKTIGDGS